MVEYPSLRFRIRMPKDRRQNIIYIFCFAHMYMSSSQKSDEIKKYLLNEID